MDNRTLEALSEIRAGLQALNKDFDKSQVRDGIENQVGLSIRYADRGRILEYSINMRWEREVMVAVINVIQKVTGKYPEVFERLENVSRAQ